MERILFATFVIKIKNRRSDVQTLSRFNGQDDFFNVFENYLNAIFETAAKVPSRNGNVPIHLTLEGRPIVDVENRVIYGYLSSGVSGESYKLRNVVTNEHFADVNEQHGAFRDLFFYLKMPTNRNRAALVLQKKSKFGAKTVLDKTVNEFFRGLGYADYKIHIDNILHGRVYRRMMDLGRLTKVEIVKKKLPNSIEEYYANNRNPREIPGVLKTTMSSSTGLPDLFRDFINERFLRRDNTRLEIGDENDIDEIEFELELNGKSKKFYIANSSRTQPDIDVTPQIEFENNKPTIESLIAQAEELIDDIIELQPRNA